MSAQPITIIAEDTTGNNVANQVRVEVDGVTQVTSTLMSDIQDIAFEIRRPGGTAQLIVSLNGGFQTDFANNVLQIGICYDITYVRASASISAPPNSVLELATSGGSALDTVFIDRADLSGNTLFSLRYNTNVTEFDTAPCCVKGSTLVLTRDRGLVPVSSLRAGDVLATKDNDTYATVTSKLRFQPTKDWILIEKGSLGNQLPHRDLYIRDGHPMLLGCKEVEPQQLLNGQTVRRVREERREAVYSLVTDNGAWIPHNGVPTKTWTPESWASWLAENNTDGRVVFEQQ